MASQQQPHPAHQQQQQHVLQGIPASHPQHPQHTQWRIQQQMYQHSQQDAHSRAPSSSQHLPQPAPSAHPQAQAHPQSQPPNGAHHMQQYPPEAVRRPMPAPGPGTNMVANSLAASLALNGHSQISATASVVGPALGRIMCCADQLTLAAASDDLEHMRNVVQDFFTPTALLKMSLYDRNTGATKAFEVPSAAIPRFTILQGCSGVIGASLSPSFVREYFLTTPDPNTRKPVHIGYVLDADAVWTSRFDNGSRVDLRGFLRAHCIVTGTRGLKIESIEFQSKHWDEIFAREMLVFEKVERILDQPESGPGGTANGSTASQYDQQPPTPSLKRKRSDTDDGEQQDKLLPTQFEKVILPQTRVGNFGITEMGMRCLEIAESVANLQDLIKTTLETGKGPLETLARLAEQRQRTTSGAQGAPHRPMQDPRWSGPVPYGPSHSHHPSQSGPPHAQPQQHQLPPGSVYTNGAAGHAAGPAGPNQIRSPSQPSQQIPPSSSQQQQQQQQLQPNGVPSGKAGSSPVDSSNWTTAPLVDQQQQQKPATRQSAAAAARSRGSARGKGRGRK